MDLRARLAASRPGAPVYARSLDEMPRDLAGATGTLAQIAIYPVKGLGALALARARVEQRGLVDPATGLADRSVLLAYRRGGTTPEGDAFDAIALSNRNEAALALARASIAQGTLVYEAPHLAPLRVEPPSLAPQAGERVRVKLAYDGGPVLEGVLDDGPLAAWVQALLRARPTRRAFDPADVIAVRPSPSHQRLVAERHRMGEPAQTLFGDGAHALVASRSTLAWMNAALAAEGARSIDMAAFRPNLVVDGLPPNAEDLIHEAEVLGADGPVRLLFASMCVRCDATRVDYATGTRPDAQPLAWLARNRPPRDADANSATFAVNAVVAAGSYGRTIAVGDAIRVASER